MMARARRKAACWREPDQHDRPGPTGSQGERGQIGLFLLGMCVLVVTFVIGVIDVTAVQRARVRLYDACDAAALDAADALSEGAAYRRGVRGRVPVTQEAVREQAGRYLAGTPRPAGVRTWQLGIGTGTTDGLSATVVLTGVIEVPIAASMLTSVLGPVTVTVSSTAEATVDPLPTAP